MWRPEVKVIIDEEQNKSKAKWKKVISPDRALLDVLTAKKKKKVNRDVCCCDGEILWLLTPGDSTVLHVQHNNLNCRIIIEICYHVSQSEPVHTKAETGQEVGDRNKLLRGRKCLSPDSFSDSALILPWFKTLKPHLSLFHSKCRQRLILLCQSQ